MKSPCIRMCTLNESDTCLGCGRMLNEITSWTSYSEQQREDIIKDCVNRMADLDEKPYLLAQTRKRSSENQ